MDGWSRLASLSSSERRALVPLLGAGFTAQAVGSTATPLPRATTALNWNALLLGVFAKAGATEAGARLRQSPDVLGAATLLWDAAATELAARTRVRASHAERRLRDAVTSVLDEALDPRARQVLAPAVDRFFALGFDDALSFSFDRLLVPRAAHVGRERSAIDLAGIRSGTRVWLPHGHASVPGTIVLGARAYGTALPGLAQAFARNRARARRGEDDGTPRTWIDVALERPLLVLGLSMSPNEWTLWWMLAARARRWARAKSRPPTFMLVKDGAPPDVARAGSLVGIEPLPCATWAEGWARIHTTLAPR